ncbi:MAG: phosphonate metabolism transcriptional regulator PhnF [Pseudomonadota bacterium]
MSSSHLKFERTTLWERVMQALTSEIDDGSLTPGDRLPAESALMARFGCSRHTVRRALSELEDLGMLRIEQGRGAFVHDTAIHYRLSRRVTHSGNLIREGRRPSSRILEIDLRPADAEIGMGLAVAAGTPVRSITSLSFADDVPISLSQNFVEAGRWPDIKLAKDGLLSMSAVYAAMGFPSYRRLSTVILSRAPDANEARLLEQPTSRWVMVTKKVDAGPDGTPICYGITAWCADRVQFVIDPEDA